MSRRFSSPVRFGSIGGALAGQADLEPHRGRLAHDVVAHHLGVAGVGPQDSGQHAHCRGLAGAVRPEQAEHAGLSGFEVDAVERGDIAEPLRQPLDPDRCIGHKHVLRGSGREFVPQSRTVSILFLGAAPPAPPRRRSRARRGPLGRAILCVLVGR